MINQKWGLRLLSECALYHVYVNVSTELVSPDRGPRGNLIVAQISSAFDKILGETIREHTLIKCRTSNQPRGAPINAANFLL